MRMKTCLLLLILGVFFPELCSAKKPWPIFTDVEVEVAIQELPDGLKYSYALKNPAKNTLSIYLFQVDLRIAENDISIGLCKLPPNLNGPEYFRRIDEAKKVDIATTSAPNKGWEIEYAGFWGASELSKQSMVNPSEILSGFVIVSGLPVGLRKFVASGYDFDFIENPEAFEFKGSLPELYFAACYTKTVVGKSIAPVAPPEPFTASSWTIRMTEDAVEARKQNWIRTDKNLSEIKKLVNSLNTENKSRLKSAVHKIETYVLAERKKGNLTDEADALVRLNAQYLLRRLENPAEQSHERSKQE